MEMLCSRWVSHSPSWGSTLSDIFGVTCGLLGDIKQSQLSPTSQVLQ